MRELSTFQTWYGRDASPPPAQKLSAGPLTLEYQDGDLRSIRAGRVELVRRIYAAVRDFNWNTIPAQISGLAIEAGADRFRVEYDAFHSAGPLRFRWRAHFEGGPDGTITCALDGQAESEFRYNRIGFCVLHPLQGITGRPYHAQTPGGPVSGNLPEAVAPQRVENGFEVPMFPSFSDLSIELENSVQVDLHFEGDLFEMEDQRNWTDGSFKTYGTPISLGYPYTARPGQRFHQKITLKVRLPARPFEEEAEGGPVRLSIGGPTGQTLPRLGFGLPSGGPEPDPKTADLLSALRPDHLRVELRLAHPGWQAEIQRAATAAARLNCPLELALFLSARPEEELALVSDALRGIPIARLIILSEKDAARGTTSAALVALARKILAPVLTASRFVGGTNGNFAQLNRQPPETGAMDGIAYPLNPQVHLSDERNLIEAIEAQRDTVRTASGFSGSLPVHISAVRLKPPFNQAAKEEDTSTAADALPANVDPRQMSLFAAAWTVGSIHSLASGGADSITYYETSGWRGLIENPSGSPAAEKFPSLPGMIFPVYWVFRFLSAARGGTLLRVGSDQPLRLGGLAAQTDRQTLLLAANYQPREQEARLEGLRPGPALVRRLNERTAPLAAFDPEAFLAAGETWTINSSGELTLTLMAYETALIEIRRDA